MLAFLLAVPSIQAAVLPGRTITDAEHLIDAQETDQGLPEGFRHRPGADPGRAFLLNR